MWSFYDDSLGWSKDEKEYKYYDGHPYHYEQASLVYKTKNFAVFTCWDNGYHESVVFALENEIEE